VTKKDVIASPFLIVIASEARQPRRGNTEKQNSKIKEQNDKAKISQK
jgi:hypothetical protein